MIDRVFVLGDISEIGPKLSESTAEAVQPEPLVRDETLRKTDKVREWDKGKKPVYGRYLLLQSLFHYLV